MKAASIALRMADFLKRYPPFEFLEEDDLVELAGAGRVKLHEVDEVIFTNGQPRDRFTYIINQGRVRVTGEKNGQADLVDLRGPGEIIGLNGLVSDEPYLNTGIAETDVLLYALPRAKFSELIQKSRKAQRYLAAYFSLHASYDGPWQRSPSEMPTTLRRGGLLEVEEPQAMAADCLVTVAAQSPGMEAAKALRSNRINCVVVVNDLGWPLGYIADSVLRERFLEGRVLAHEPAASLMCPEIITAKPTDDTGKFLVRLTRSGERYLVVTEDGTERSRALGLVSERNIFLQYGRFPTVLGETMAEAKSFDELRALRDRCETLILEFLENRELIPWLMEITGVLNRALTARVLGLAAAAMAADGWEKPTVEYSWLMMGSGGRDELLIRSAVYHALMYEDPSPFDAEKTQSYFRELGRRATDGIRECGFLDSEQGILASEPDWCLSRTGMFNRFSRMISDPVQNMVYTFRDAFDFRPVEYHCPLALSLRVHINTMLSAYPNFLRHMAKDSLLNQPPRTLFQQYVVDEKGMQKEELEIKHHALLPLVDAARVLALATSEISTTSTYMRFRHSVLALSNFSESDQALVNEAAEAFLVLAFARTGQGLKSGTNGAVIRPADLDPEIRPLLKTAFRTILSILEMIALRYDLELRV